MSGESRRRFRFDDEGVSEVVGYLLSFTISFMLLIASLYTFNVLATKANRLAAEAELTDVANRVGRSVLEVFDVGTVLRQTQDTAASGTFEPLVYRRSVDVPAEFRGASFRATLTETEVTVESADSSIVVTSTTFKASEVLAPNNDPAQCDLSYVVCHISGTSKFGAPSITVTYEYNRAAVPVVNQIIIS